MWGEWGEWVSVLLEMSLLIQTNKNLDKFLIGDLLDKISEMREITKWTHLNLVRIGERKDRLQPTAWQKHKVEWKFKVGNLTRRKTSQRCNADTSQRGTREIETADRWRPTAEWREKAIWEFFAILEEAHNYWRYPVVIEWRWMRWDWIDHGHSSIIRWTPTSLQLAFPP